MNWSQILAIGALAGLAAAVHAHGDDAPAQNAGPVQREQTAWGIGGDAASVRRTVEIRMLDTMRYTPDRIDVQEGETIRLVMINTGQTRHELVIGTKKGLERHAALMQKFPNMEHEEPYMAHVAPGTTGEIIWTFNRAGDFDFGCLMPGHYEAGMAGTIHVARADALRNTSKGKRP